MRYSIPQSSLNVDGSDGFFQFVGTAAELLQLLVGQVILDFSTDSLAVHDAQYTQADIGNAVFSVHHGGDRQRCAGAVEDALDDVAGQKRPRRRRCLPWPG